MRNRLLILVAMSISALLVAACGGNGDEDVDNAGGGQGGGEAAEAASGHIHGLGINPNGGDLFIATHGGLFRAPRGDTVAKRVGDSEQDTMGFTVAGPDRFLGSGHPGPGESRPPLLGLIESFDAGRSWSDVSLSGEADFHVLRAAGRNVYGFDGAGGRFMASDDGGRSWETREVPGPLIDLAVDRRNPRRLVAVSQTGLLRSTDGGEGWRPLGDAIGLLAWTKREDLFLVDAGGGVQFSDDGGKTWSARGDAGGQPVAFLGERTGDLYVALADGTVKQSGDGGASWTVRATVR